MATRGLPEWPLCRLDADSLPEAERLVLDAIRRWGAGGPAGPLGEAALVLAAAGAEGAALPLDGALRALAPWRPEAPLAPRLAPGERALLLACAALQRGRRPLALALLHPVAPPLPSHPGLASLALFARSLAAAGARLADPP